MQRIKLHLTLLALCCLSVQAGYCGQLNAAVTGAELSNDIRPWHIELQVDHWIKIHEQQPADVVRFTRQQHGGAAFDSRRGRIILFGSDTHGRNWSNSPFYFDTQKLSWHRIYPDDAPHTYSVTRDGVAVAGKEGNHPWAMHTFDAVEYNARRDELIVASYPGHLVPGRFTDALIKQWSKVKRHATWTLNLSTQTWNILPIEPVHFFPYATAYDSHRGVIIGYRSDGIYELSGELRRWLKVSGPGLLGYHNNAVYDSLNKALVVFGSNKNSNDIVVYRPASGKHHKMLTLGMRPYATQYAPMAFHPKIGKTVVLVGNGQTKDKTETWLYDLATDRWVKLQSAIVPMALGMNYNLVYDPKRNVLLLVTGDESTQTTVWALKLE